MIPEIPNINAFVAKDRYAEMSFDTLRAKFSSSSKDNIKKLETVLKSDNISVTVKRGFLLRWELTMEIPIIAEFNEAEYQKIIGKIFLLASRTVVHLGTIGLLG